MTSSDAKSKSFADLVLSLSDGERNAMALDILSAINDDGKIPPDLVSIEEIGRASTALLHLAQEIDVNHPGGNGW